MAQSYTVFIGSNIIQFGNEGGNKVVFNRKLTNLKDEDLQLLINELENTKNQQIQIIGNIEKNWSVFSSHFHLIEAAGGLVKNEQKEWLFIFRNGTWDLPKGKWEEGETIKECAVREVAEECGIEEPKIVSPLSPTYHTYKLNGQHILKKTHWFAMKSEDDSELIPQTEEGITDVKWVAISEAEKLARDSFGSIKEVITEGLKSYS